MPEERYKPALRQALQFHEIGDKSPYQLFFAAKGKSGASFGFMQGDLAAQQPIVQRTFHQCLSTSGFTEDEINSLARQLSVHLIRNPLSREETERVNAALDAHRDLVNAMDDTILMGVYSGLDKCLAAATNAHRTIQPRAQLYIAMWINMSGPPSKMLEWLAGHDPQLGVRVDPPGPEVDVPAVQGYLKATSYYRENPRNFAHLEESANAGATKLP
jgi:hypothetical protein